MMRNLIVSLALLSALWTLPAAAQKMQPWEDPGVFEINRLPMAATFATLLSSMPTGLLSSSLISFLTVGVGTGVGVATCVITASTGGTKAGITFPFPPAGNIFT